MHASQYAHMVQCVDRYLNPKREYRVLDFGSGLSPGQKQTNHGALEGYKYTYVGVDVREGENVDIVMTKPYTIPLPSNSADVIVSGSVFEHVPFFWASILEMARVLKPGGFIFLSLPSRGHKHTVVDCWRFYPDGLRAAAAAARLELLEAHTHFPPMNEQKRHDYAAIDEVEHYWGDTVGVFKKPGRYAPEMLVIRPVVRWWANRSADLAARPKQPSCRI